MTGPVIEIVENKEAAESRAKVLDVAFVGSFSAKDNAQFTLFHSVADGNRVLGKFIVYIDSNAKNEVAVYRKGEGLAVTHRIEKKDDLQEFLNEERFPYFGPINGDNYGDYYSRGRDLVWFLSSESDYKKNAKVLREAAKQLRSTNYFVWLDSDELKKHDESAVRLDKLPSLELETKTGRYVFPENKFESASDIVRFFKDVAAGKIERMLLSDEPPQTNDEPVKIVVGKSFEKMVLRPDKDVLLEVYASW